MSDVTKQTVDDKEQGVIVKQNGRAQFYPGEDVIFHVEIMNYSTLMDLPLMDLTGHSCQMTGGIVTRSKTAEKPNKGQKTISGSLS